MHRSSPAAVLTMSLALACTAGAPTQLSANKHHTATAAPPAHTQVATFAGGCFWCVESAFDGVPGVIEALSGYMGGDAASASYKRVSSGSTSHLEAVQVRYDPERIRYERLLEIFWTQIDPTDAGGQFADRGPQYQTAIFYHDDTQRRLAMASKAELSASGRFDKPIVTPVRPATEFYAAEEYHQDYHHKNPAAYASYRRGSGREAFIARAWAGGFPHPEGKAFENFNRPSDAELAEVLTELQFRVTRHDATEPAFKNTYLNNKAEGIYVDVISGEPLFSSTDKFDSGTGWPSFTRALEPDNVRPHEDRSLGMLRVEVRSRFADSHLGHVFKDGPAPTGKRYCINSAALRFIAKEDLAAQGYGHYAKLFAP